ncbi:MAG: DMT family transporter [Chlorobiota bacterium]
MSNNITHWRAELMLLLMTLIWGATFMFTKIGLESSPPFFYLILRFSVALFMMLIFYNKYLRKVSKKTLKQGAILGLLFGSGFVLQTYGLEFTAITNSAFITGLTVVLTPFAFKIISKNSISFWPKIGVVMAFVGLYIFTKPDINSINLGDILTLISTSFWAIYITFMDKFTKGDDSKERTIQLVALQFMFVLPLPVLGFLIYELPDFYISFETDLIVSVLFNGVLASFVLTIIHTTYQRYTTPVKAALIFSLEPIFASLFALTFMSEILTNRELIGASILMLGVLLSELGGFVVKKLKLKSS